MVFGVGIVAAGSYRGVSRGACQMDKGDAGALLGFLVSTAVDRLNISRDEAVTRILSQPDFVTTLNNGREPQFYASILSNFDASAALYMSAIALANQYHLSEYTGMATAMCLVRIKRAVCAVPEIFSRLFYRNVNVSVQ